MYYVGQVLYYQLNIDYIIETYCVNKEKPELQCNGKCHLAKQLQVTSNNASDDDQTGIINVLVESFFPVFIQTSFLKQVEEGVFEMIRLENYDYVNFYAFHLNSKLYKPPIV